MTALRSWLDARTPRERRLLLAAAAVATALVVAGVANAVVDDFRTLAARVEAHARELATVRRLAATLAETPNPVDDPGLVARLQATLAPIVGAERLASLTPLDARGGRATLRLANVTLPEVVQVLYRIEHDPAGLRVTRLDLAKHPDDPHRFELAADVGRGGTS